MAEEHWEVFLLKLLYCEMRIIILIHSRCFVRIHSFSSRKTAFVNRVINVIFNYIIRFIRKYYKVSRVLETFFIFCIKTSKQRSIKSTKYHSHFRKVYTGKKNYHVPFEPNSIKNFDISLINRLL